MFHQELADTAPMDEPQGRLGDSDRWMSWEPKAPLAVPDHIGDSTEDDSDSEEDSSDTEEVEVADRKPVRDDVGDEKDEKLDKSNTGFKSSTESREESRGRWSSNCYICTSVSCIRFNVALHVVVRSLSPSKRQLTDHYV